jgi:hypothetical protein
MEKDDKKIEFFIDRLMSSGGLEQPTKNFTENIMLKVDAVSESSAIVYKPLISKSVWFLIFGTFIVLVASLYLNEPIANNGWLNKIEWPNLSLNSIPNFSFNFSETAMYAFAFLAIMIGIQIPLLKYYFNKRLVF